MPSRQHARHVLDEAAAGDVREALHRRPPPSARAPASRRCAWAPAARRRALPSSSARRAAPLRRSCGSANSRSSARRSRRGPSTASPGAMRAAVDDPALLDHADAEAGEVVFALGVHAGHLGGLAADQRAAGLLAALGDAADHARGDARRRACRRRSSRGRTAARRPARARR